MIARLFLCCLAALLTAGCATVNSNLSSDSTLPAVERGVPYYLPKALVGVSLLRRTDDTFVVKVEAPIMVADSAYLFHADLRHGGFSDDTIEIKVDPTTSLLTSADISSTGRAADILENAAKTLGMLQGSGETAGETIFFGLYDPAAMAAASADANQALASYYGRLCGRYGDLSDAAYDRVKRDNKIGNADDLKDMADTLARCRLFRMMGVDSGTLISIALLGDDNKALDRGAIAALLPEPSVLGTDAVRACRRGVCYRPMMPIRIGTTIAGTYQSSDIFMIPARNRLSHAELTGGVFATQKYTLTFDKGALVTAKYDMDSEAVGIATLPVKLVTAFISGPATVLGLKSNAMKAEDDYLKAATTHTKAVEEAAKLCATSVQGCPNTAYKIMGVEAPTRNADRPVTDSGGTKVPQSKSGDRNDGPVFDDDDDD